MKNILTYRRYAMKVFLKKTINVLIVISFLSSNIVYASPEESALRAISANNSLVPNNFIQDLKVSSSGKISDEEAMSKILDKLKEQGVIFHGITNVHISLAVHYLELYGDFRVIFTPEESHVITEGAMVPIIDGSTYGESLTDFESRKVIDHLANLEIVSPLSKSSSAGLITAEDILENMLTREDIKKGQTLDPTAKFLLDLPNKSDRAYFGALYRQYKLQLMVDRQADVLLESNPLLSKEEAMNQARALVASELRKSKREGDAIILEDAKPLIIGQNFSPSAILSDRDFSEKLGAVQYEDLEKDPENIKSAARVTMVQNPMNGGIGQAMDRIDFLKAIWQATGRKGKPSLGAKSMDSYFKVNITINGEEKDAFVSVAEATILALLHEVEKEQGAYRQGILEEFISEETRQAMVDLMDTVYLYDRLDPSIQDKRTYGDILKGKGMLGVMPEQAVFPRFSVEDNYKLTDKYTAPGSHGHWGVYAFSNIPDNVLPEDASIQIRAIFNGDGISNAPNNVIAGWMAREHVPVVMITTTRAPIDVKGGMLGIENLENGKYRTNLLELADAKTNDKKYTGQAELFAKMGIVSSKDERFGRKGMPQLFNTNTVMQNDTALQPFLRDLREALGLEEYNRIISPKMMMKSAVQKDGKEYVQLEGPLGSSVLSLAGFLSTTDDPIINMLCKKHNIDKDNFLRIVNIDVDKRTDFFAPIKFPIDYWMQFFSDHFKVDTTTWKLVNLRPGHVPALDTPDQDKDKYYSNVLNLFHLFGDNGVIDKDNPAMTSTIGLDYMKIRGKVKVAGSILRGRFVAINQGDDIADLTSIKAREQLVNEKAALLSGDGKLILEDVLIVIDKDKKIEAVKLQQDDDIDAIIDSLTSSKSSSAGITLSEKDSENIKLAAEAASLSTTKGTVAYDDTVLSVNQQQALQSIIGLGTQGLRELQLKLGCKVRLLSQGSLEDSEDIIIISNRQLSEYQKARYFIVDQTHIDLQDKAVYIAVFSHIPIAKGLLGLSDKVEQPRLYSALRQSIRSLSQGLLNEREIEEAIDAYINGKPLLIKLPPAVSYEGRFEELQRAALMALISA
jgi:hypothetical protein